MSKDKDIPEDWQAAGRQTKPPAATTPAKAPEPSADEEREQPPAAPAVAEAVKPVEPAKPVVNAFALTVDAAHRDVVQKFAGLADSLRKAFTKARKQSAEWHSVLATDLELQKARDAMEAADNPKEFFARRDALLSIQGAIADKSVSGLTRRIVDQRVDALMQDVGRLARDLADKIAAEIAERHQEAVEEEQAFFRKSGAAPSVTDHSRRFEALRSTFASVTEGLANTTHTGQARPALEPLIEFLAGPASN